MELTELKKFTFPVKKTQGMFIDREGKLLTTKKSNSIIRLDTNEFISHVKPSYKIIPNEEIISSAIMGIDKVGYKFDILKNLSYVDNQKMDICIGLPELKYLEGTKDEGNILVHLRNAYDGSSSVSFDFGTYRLICSNGALIRNKAVFSSYHRKHTRMFSINDFSRAIELAYSKIPAIGERYEILRNMEISEQTMTAINHISKKVEKVVASNLDNPSEMTEYEPIKNMLVLYNLLTNFVTHQIKTKNQLTYHQKISTIFGV